MKRHIITIAGLVAALAIGIYLLACDRADKKPLEKITIAYSATQNAALAEIALKQGYYHQEGLEAIAILHSFGKAALDDLLAGNADFATVAETPVILAILKGEKISIIATIQTYQTVGIVARKDKGIFAPGDLRGRKIAAIRGTSSDFFLDIFLIEYGIKREAVKIVYLKPDELQNALAVGDVDAVSAFELYLLQSQKALGSKGVTFRNTDIFKAFFNIVAKQEFVRQNPGKVRAMLRSLIRAEKFASQNPVAAQQMVAEFSRADPALVRELWDSSKDAVALDQSLILALEDESRWAIRSGLTKATKIPNYLDYIYLDGLKSVKPEAVRILR